MENFRWQSREVYSKVYNKAYISDHHPTTYFAFCSGITVTKDITRINTIHSRLSHGQKKEKKKKQETGKTQPPPPLMRLQFTQR